MEVKTQAAYRKNPLLSVLFWICLTLLYLPLLYLVFQSFLLQPHNLKSGFTLKHLIRLFETQAFWQPLMTSLFVGFASATMAVVLGTAGAVGTQSHKAKLASVFQFLVILPVLLPEVITGLSLLLLFLFIKIPLGYFTLILAHASFTASFAYFIIDEQLRQLHPSLGEAAQDLGAKPQEVFWKITLPNILPGIFGAWLMAFTLSFDDFLISFFTSGAGVTTLPLKIYSLLRMGISPELNSLSFLMLAITALLVCILVSRERSRQWLLKR